jgi:PAS domain S-box-containing protein
MADFAQDRASDTPATRIAELEARVQTLEHELRRESRYRTFFDAIEAGFCVIEMKFDESGRAMDYRFLETNTAFELHTGLTDATGRWVRDMVPTHEQHWFELYGNVARSGKSVRFENVAEGLGRWFDVHALRDGEPGQHRVAVLFSDISERRRAEEALRTLNQRLEHEVAARTTDRNQLWTLSRDIMLRCRTDGEIIAVNPAWEKALGWSESELIGSSLYSLVHPDDAALTRQAAIDYANGRPLPIFENRYRTKKGEYRWMAWTVQFGQDVLNAVGRDVTDERAKEDMLRETEAQLRQSQKMEAVGQLTGGIAHDFNNLLTAIAASLQLLNFRVGRGQFTGVERYVSAAEGAVKRAAALTHRLLAFSRKQTLDEVPTHLGELAMDIEELIARTIGPNCEIELACADEVWDVRIDRNQMESALLNLCINARDAMPDGGRVLIGIDNVPAGHAQLRRLGLDSGDFVVARVTDDGTGMTPDVVARAFDPFFTTKPQGKGTGLGLSMIYGFARQSGGQATIDTMPGRGTTVSIYLPRYENADGARDADIEAQTPTLAPQDTTSATILVVDDEDAIRMLLTEVLEEAGYRVLEAADATSARSLIESDAPLDLLVTDIGLPGDIDGHALASIARTRRTELPVLFITGHGELVEDERMNAGAHLLLKPFSMDVLASTVKDIMSEA